jgi:hypothetical protein
METQLKALGQWEIIDGTVRAPTPVNPAAPTPNEVREPAAWKLRTARAYAEIALRVEDDIGDVFTTTDDPYDAWVYSKPVTAHANRVSRRLSTLS